MNDIPWPAIIAAASALVGVVLGLAVNGRREAETWRRDRRAEAYGEVMSQHQMVRSGLLDNAEWPMPIEKRRVLLDDLVASQAALGLYGTTKAVDAGRAMVEAAAEVAKASQKPSIQPYLATVHAFRNVAREDFGFDALDFTVGRA